MHYVRSELSEVKFVCLITNFNYLAYIQLAIRSALDQSLPFDRIIIVDDGSTDGSKDFLLQFAEENNVEVIFQLNQGQAAAIRSGVELLDDDAIVCLLDSDDLYPTDYLLEVSQCVCDGIDFYFTQRRVLNCEKDFNPETEQVNEPVANANYMRIHKPVGRVNSILMNDWLGVSTSGLALRAKLIKELLSLVDSSKWKTRADDPLIVGASYLEKTKIESLRASFIYRLHGSNNYASRRRSFSAEARREAALFALYDALHPQGFPGGLDLFQFTLEGLKRRGLIGLSFALKRSAIYVARLFIYSISSFMKKFNQGAR